MTSAGSDHARFAGAPIPSPPVADDDGSPAPELREALDSLAAGGGGGASVLEALSQSRLLVPVVAILDDGLDGGLRQEKQSSMAAVLVDSARHGRALLAFSGSTPLAAWNPNARPVPLIGALAARAAVAEDAAALVVDVAGPTPFAVTGYELLLLASVAGASQPLSADPLLRRAIERIIPVDAGLEVVDAERGQPSRLVIVAELNDAQRRAVVESLAADRVIAQLVPQGLRVVFSDTRGQTDVRREK